MKTAIVQLDKFDNVISIQEKLVWSKTQRILLVWPNKGTIQLKPLEIILILRYAEDLGAQVAVVCDDLVLIKQMKELGISVFSSIPESQKKPWRKPKIKKRSKFQSAHKIEDLSDYLNLQKSQRKSELPKGLRWFLFSIGIVSVFLVVLLFIPSAEVIVYPKTQNQHMNFNFQAEPMIKVTDNLGSIPVHLYKTVIEQQLEGESTGIIRIPDKSATGEVVFQNLSDKMIEIPKGTIVQTLDTPPIIFQTTKKVELEPGVTSQVSVPIECLLGGSIGNIPEGKIVSIENNFGGNLTVINNKPTVGGIDIKTFSPSETDYKNLRQKLLDNLKEIAIEEIQQYNSQAVLIPIEGIKIIEIQDEEKTPEIGSPGERFVLRMKVEISAWIISQDDIENSINLRMDRIIPDNFSADYNSITFSIDNNSIVFQDNSLKWDCYATREIHPNVNKNTIIQSILGKKMDTALEILNQQVPQSKESWVEIKPKFWKMIPFLPFQINLIVDNA